MAKPNPKRPGPNPKGVMPPGIARYREEQARIKELREQGIEPEAENVEEQVVEKDIAGALPGDLGAIFLDMKAAAESKDAETALDALNKAMGRLPAEAVSKLVETPTYQKIAERAAAARSDRKAGDPIRNAEGKIIGYVPWKREDFLGPEEERITFMGEENVKFYVNGVEWFVGEGIQTTLPRGIYDYYMENRQERRKAATGQGAYSYLESASGGKVIKG